MSMNAHVRKGNGWWGGETTLKNGELSVNYQTTKTTQEQSKQLFLLISKSP